MQDNNITATTQTPVVDPNPVAPMVDQTAQVDATATVQQPPVAQEAGAAPVASSNEQPMPAVTPGASMATPADTTSELPVVENAGAEPVPAQPVQN